MSQNLEQRVAELESRLRTPHPQKLQVVEGDLQPLSKCLKALKASRTSVAGIDPLMDGDYVMDRGDTAKNAGINQANLMSAWSTIVHLRAKDPGGYDAESLKADLDDFKSWLQQDPEFVAAINLSPRLAVLWFVDCWLASIGEMDDEDDDE